MEYVKSPLNYTGGKFKLLPQLLEIFPKDINTFVDLFAGGGNVAVNVKAKHIIYNDSMWQLSEMLQEFKSVGAERCLERIDRYIEEYQLSKDNKEGYLKLRKQYNEPFNTEFSVLDPIMLYTLICYSFNNQIRFNSKQEYNVPFGKNRGFNPALREKFIVFVNQLQEIDIEFHSEDFRKLNVSKLGAEDFVYCDPPYLIAVASYNENGGWGEQVERELLNKLDGLNETGIRFALSNILESKGKSNEDLKKWAEKYRVIYLDGDHSNCSYHRKDRTSKDIEVLVVNY